MAVCTGCKRPAHTTWDRFYRFNAPQILGFSLTSFRLDTPPADWKIFDYAITGDWVLSTDDLPEEPHAALLQFIEAGEEPPLYIGWGSMVHKSGQYMTELAVRCTRPGSLQQLPPCPHRYPSPFGNHR